MRDTETVAIKILINQTIRAIINHLPMYGSLFLSRAYFWYWNAIRSNSERICSTGNSRQAAHICVYNMVIIQETRSFIYTFSFSPCDLKIDLIIHVSALLTARLMCVQQTLAWYISISIKRFIIEEETENKTGEGKKKHQNFMRKLSSHQMCLYLV